MTRQKIAIVTGGGRGIGRSTALALARREMKVVLTYQRSADAADGTRRMIEEAGGTAATSHLDVTDLASIDTFTRDLTGTLTAWHATAVDVLVNNAGIGLFAPIEEVTVEDFDATIATNFRGTFFLIQALLPRLGDGSRIINVSTSSTRHVSPGMSVYASSKAAVEALSLHLSGELGSRGIRINSVAPGPTATDFNGGAMRDDPALRSYLADHTALGRVGHPEEIADAVVALASDDMRWVTAQRIEVSGGALV